MAEKEKDKDKKSFWQEFKEFISRGNILDMAIGVIIGGAFTAIVTALSDQILKPIINWILALIMGKDSLTEVYTVLKPVYDQTTGALDLAQSIYIDWGAFINAIINFLLIALVLFVIFKIVMKISKMRAEFKEEVKAAAEKKRLEREAMETAEQGGTSESAPEADSLPAEEKPSEETEEKKE